jgi:hypothetical protein
MEEEKEELSNDLVVALKQKITTLEEQVAELHLTVYDPKDDFGVLRMATNGKLKHLAKALATHHFMMLHLLRAALEKFGNNFKGIRIRSCLLSIISLFIQK